MRTGDFQIPDGQKGNLYTGPIPTLTGAITIPRPTFTDDETGVSVSQDLFSPVETGRPTATVDEEEPTETTTGAEVSRQTPTGADDPTEPPTEADEPQLVPSRTRLVLVPSQSVFIGQAAKSDLEIGMWIVASMLVANVVGYLGINLM